MSFRFEPVRHKGNHHTKQMVYYIKMVCRHCSFVSSISIKVNYGDFFKVLKIEDYVHVFWSSKIKHLIRQHMDRLT